MEKTCIWDLDEKKCLTSFQSPQKIVSLKYANKILAAGFQDGSIYVWQFATFNLNPGF